jgi:hypothetical protein
VAKSVMSLKPSGDFRSSSAPGAGRRVMIASGLIKVVQSGKMLNWIGFIWHLLRP